MSIGDRIKALRLERANYSQLKLAKDAGLTPAAISQYESNIRKPNADALQKIAAALKVSVDCLLGDDTLDTNDNSDQQVLLRHFSQLSEQDKKQIEDYIKFLASKSENK